MGVDEGVVNLTSILYYSIHNGIYLYMTCKTIRPVILRCWAVGVSWRPWDHLGMIHRQTVGMFVVCRQCTDFCFKFVAP